MFNHIDKKFWNKKKVFVTGHSGFKGSWLCIILNFLGAEITGYSLEPPTKPSLFKLAGIKNLIKKSIVADVRDYKKLFNEIKKSKASIVFHLAAQPIVRLSYRHAKETFDTNFTGSLNVLESIKNLKTVKAGIIITTDKVYEEKGNRVFRETDKLGGIDPYSSSKVCVEFLFNTYRNCFFPNLKSRKIATVRAGNVIGGGDYSIDRLIPDIYRYAKKKKNIILRNPSAVRPWQHVLEPLSGYLLLAQKIHTFKKKDIEQNWNFGPSIACCKSVKYLANYLAKNLGIKVIVKRESLLKFKSETNVLRLSNFKSKKYLGWQPRWTLNETLNKIIEWNNLIKKNNSRLVCLKQIKDYFNI